MQSNSILDKATLQKTVDFIRQHIRNTPTVAIICGSGLGKLASAVRNPITLEYKNIPNFPQSTVEGHAGNLVFGEIGNKYVMVMQGRFHSYEGYSSQQIIFPIRVMKLLGVQVLLISNAAGGLNRTYNVGDLTVIKDHISLPNIALQNVLIGPNDPEFGERFPATSDAYSARLRKLFKEIASEKGYSNIVREGIYAHAGGPTYDTPAESRMILSFGADVIGMSTAPEVIVARHAKMEVFGISLVTNQVILSEESTVKTNHQEVLETSAMRGDVLRDLFVEMINRL